MPPDQATGYGLQATGDECPVSDLPLVPVTVDRVHNNPQLAWAEGMCFRLPYPLLAESGLLDGLDGHGRLVIEGSLAPADTGFAEQLRMRAAFTEKKPTSSRIPFSYQRIPARVRSLVASLIGRWQRRRSDRWAAYPAWPLDLSADFAADLIGDNRPLKTVGPTPVVLSHDLDSPEGIANLHRWFLDAEEAVGARSVNFVVPCAWSLDLSVLEDVVARGHRLGIHGYDHSNKTAFAAPDERRRRLAAGRDHLAQLGVNGYRAPSLLRTAALIDDLAPHYLYDSSIPTSGGLFPVANNGCASARPFQFDDNGNGKRLWEFPLSLPRDGSLRFLGHSAVEIAALWKRCATTISQAGGVVVLLTHCEERFSGNVAMKAAYEDFLAFIVASPRFEWQSPEVILGTGEASGERSDGANSSATRTGSLPHLPLTSSPYKEPSNARSD